MSAEGKNDGYDEGLGEFPVRRYLHSHTTVVGSWRGLVFLFFYKDQPDALLVAEVQARVILQKLFLVGPRLLHCGGRDLGQPHAPFSWGYFARSSGLRLGGISAPWIAGGRAHRCGKPPVTEGILDGSGTLLPESAGRLPRCRAAPL